MLTIDDIRSDKRKSGFAHVQVTSDPLSYRASGGGRKAPGKTGAAWQGQRRTQAIEAAQDYCNYMNGQTTMLTIDDLRNPKRKSGFNYVGSATAGANAAGRSAGSSQLWRMQPPGWKVSGDRGKARKTPEEAAQDYCDYTNGQQLPAVASWDAPTIDMGTIAKHAPSEPSVKIERKTFKGPHDRYDILLYDKETGQVIRRKVGITARGEARFADVCKTFGFSIKPYNRPVTYQTKAKAEAAESSYIAAIVANESKEWRRVGKESFAPVRKMTV